MSNYVAYCFDEAVVFFGLQLEAMLDDAGTKPDKESRKIEAARKRVLDNIFDDGKKKKGSGFADPAVLFN